MKSAEDIRTAVEDRYERLAVTGSSCCGDDGSSDSVKLGYSAEDLAQVPQGADMNLGCGAPVRLAELTGGERVLDLGSGGGLDVFLAAREVGDSGNVIGVDMTPAMIERARSNADEIGASNVEFRQGMIEQLPVDDDSIDVVLSNCVINLAPDKGAAFAEAFRVLAPGGRLVVSDIVSGADAQPIDPDPDSWASCIDGAIPEAQYLGGLEKAGFAKPQALESGNAGDGGVYSVTVRATKRAER